MQKENKMNKATKSSNKSNSKKIEDTKLKLCEIMQYAEYLSEETIIKALEEHKNCISRYAYILHDKDVYTEDDNLPEGKSVGDKKKPHFHVIIQFKSNYGRLGRQIIQWFGIEPQYLQKCKASYKGKNGEFKGFKAMCYYLIHENRPEKYQYPVSEVKSNFDYQKFIETGNIEYDIRLEEIQQAIAKGVIKEYNISDYVSMNEYNKYARAITNAFEYKRIQDAMSKDRNMTVMYICGTSGSGKTLYAKEIAQKKDILYL